MPYFKWYGSDLYGNEYRGLDFAISQSALEKLLKSHDISLIESITVQYVSFFKKIKLSQRVLFFKDLAILLDSGIVLPQALKIISEQLKGSLKIITDELVLSINEGVSFSDAIKNYDKVFNSLEIYMIQAGQESGNFSEALSMLAQYLENKDNFEKKLRSALFVPILTFIVFLLIAGLIFLFIIPSFSNIFDSFNKKIPYITNLLITFSNFFKDWLLTIILGMFIALASLTLFFKCPLGKRVRDYIFLKIPFFNRIIIYSNLACFFQAASLLIFNGLHVIKAILISNNSISNYYIKQSIEYSVKDINEGSPLATAFNKNCNNFPCDIIAMVNVGEESAKLDFIFKKIGNICNARSDRLLSFFITILQPILVIILGILTAILIFAIYLPIFNLVNVIE